MFIKKLKLGLKTALERQLARYGYELRPKGRAPLSYASFLNLCGAGGLLPKTVFDVGVGTGTPWLYRAFPGSKFVLIEPLRRFEADLRRISAEIGADYKLTALGEAPGNLTIRIPDQATGASMKMRSEIWTDLTPEQPAEEFESVPVQDLDSIAPEYEPPFVLKLDVEGFELDVLRGATRSLEMTDLIIAEASIIPRHKDDSLLQDIVSYLSGRGFDLLELVEISQLRAGGPTAYLDAAFVRRGSALQHSYWRS